jgi:cell shape-determining protein MreD
MKTFGAYVMLCLGVIVAQTTVLGLPLLHGVFYDLLIPVVIFLRLNLSMRTGALLTLLSGLVMDIFSGAPFGLCVSIYIWIFIGVESVSAFCDVRGRLFQSILVAVSVLFENLVCWLLSTSSGTMFAALSDQLGAVVWQTSVAAITGPWVILFLEKAHARMRTSPQANGRNLRSLWTTHS